MSHVEHACMLNYVYLWGLAAKAASISSLHCTILCQSNSQYSLDIQKNYESILHIQTTNQNLFPSFSPRHMDKHTTYRIYNYARAVWQLDWSVDQMQLVIFGLSVVEVHIHILICTYGETTSSSSYVQTISRAFQTLQLTNHTHTAIHSRAHSTPLWTCAFSHPSVAFSCLRENDRREYCTDSAWMVQDKKKTEKEITTEYKSFVSWNDISVGAFSFHL